MAPETTSRTFALVLAACVVLHAGAASADDTAAAERLFRDGRAAMLEGRFDVACPMLAESQRLDPHVGTLLNLAACHERQGKVASAWVEYQRALTAARADGQPERARLAEGRLAVLEPRVPWLRVTSRAPDVTIALDDAPLAAASLDHDMPVDPGAHVVLAERNGARVFEERLELREGERRTVAVDARAEPPASDAPPPERVVVEPKAAAPTERAPEKPLGRWIFEPGLFVGYVGGATNTSRSDGEVDVTVYPSNGGPFTSCREVSCSRSGIEEGGGVTAGVNVFGGYALSDDVDLGLRFIAAPPIGRNGPSVLGVGPSIVLHPTPALGIGAWLLFGDSTMKGSALVSAPNGYTGAALAHSEGSINGGFGAGVEVSLKVWTLKRGSLVVNTTPFFIAGANGNAFCLPVGIGYHFQ